MLSNIISHEISKSIDVGFQLRGREFPLGGIYKVWGSTPKGHKGPRPFIEIAFSPNGAMDSINSNFVSSFIRETEGSLKMLKFAESSDAIKEAKFDRAKKEIAKTGKFIYEAVGLSHLR